jgi:CHAT domain-containing protein
LGANEVESFGAGGIRDVLEREVRGDGGDRGRPLVVVHDAPLSRVPWEALHFNGLAPALAGGLTHRYDGGTLSVAKWRDERARTPGLDMLLVVNPTEDLDGAEREGERISRLFGGASGVRIRKLRGAEARRSELLRCFRSGLFDVVHYAGHAFFDPEHLSRSGILCHGGEVLSGADLAGLAQLPSLVFFNACEAARVRRLGEQQGPTDEAVRGTIGFAESFLSGGVANYLGTYWPVGDDAAAAFATTFYGDLLKGAALGSALLGGRRAVRETRSADWANYVLYGSSEFVLNMNED